MNLFNVACYFIGLVMVSVAVANFWASAPIGFMVLGGGAMLFPIIEYFVE